MRVGRRRSALVVAIALAAAAVPAAPAAAQTAWRLDVSSAADRSAPQTLGGSTLSGNRYVFVSPTTGASRVRFYLDDPNRTRTPIKTENTAPWDFAGTAEDATRLALPWDTTKVANGTHTITAAITPTSGSTQVITASFQIANSVQGPPDQVHLAWVAEPSTTLTVSWRTRGAGTPSRVEYRPAGETAWQPVPGSPRASGTAGQLHEATIAGLTPGSPYEYRVLGDGGVWSEVFSTRTAPPRGPADFDVVYFADTGLIGRTDGLATGTAQVRDEIARLDALLTLPGGDYAYFDTDKRFGTLENTIDAWFNQVQPFAAEAPMMPTYGNHEVLLGEGFLPWSQRFPTPSGFDSRREYSFDIGEVHFTSITAVDDTAGLSDATLQWIDQDLAAARAAGTRWLVPYFHVAPFADGFSHPSNLNLRRQLGPIFERHGVKLVLTSHDQSYERTYPLRDVPATNSPTTRAKRCYLPSEGTTWVKTSPAGKLSNRNGNFSLFRTDPQQSYIAVRDDTMHHFTRVRFYASGSARVETFGVKGDGSPPVIVDSFIYSTGGCAPEVTFSRDASTFVAAPGSPTSQSLRVTTTDSSGDVSVSDDAPWLSVSPTAGPSGTDLTLTADATGLPGGTHLARVTATSPGRESATHVVKLVVRQPHELLVSTSPDRSNAQPLHGATVSGQIYVFLSPESGVTRVRFWLDQPSLSGTPRQTEKNPPWDFAGGESGGLPNPFNTSTLSAGSHTISAVADLTGGGTETVHATFVK
jgi:Purple acid Phosphatase, N-terminal domain/Calcineurin-like phosphoesterase